jgi:hypothetical protein
MFSFSDCASAQYAIRTFRTLQQLTAGSDGTQKKKRFS